MLFADHIGAALLADPDFVDPSCVYIDAVAYAVRLLGLGVLGVRDSELALEDEVCGEAGMRVRAVVGVAFL